MEKMKMLEIGKGGFQNREEPELKTFSEVLTFQSVLDF